MAPPQSGNAPGRSPSPLSPCINTTCPFLFQLPFTIPLHPSVSPRSLSCRLLLAALGSLARTSTHTWTTPKAGMIARLATAATPHSRSCSLSCSNLLSLLLTRTRPSRIVVPRRSRLCWLLNALTLLVPRPLLGVSPFPTGAFPASIQHACLPARQLTCRAYRRSP